MDEKDKVYKRIEDMLDSIPEGFSVLEEQIDISVQMEYFEQAKLIKEDLDKQQVLDSAPELLNENVPDDRKKMLLSELASLNDVKAYRIIEKFKEEADEKLKDWAVLAYQEAKLGLQSQLLEENQVFISTGMGGKGDKLRYFLVFLSKDESDFTETQQKVICNEFRYKLKESRSEIEEIEFSENIACMIALIPIKAPIKTMLRTAIKESNNYGDFLHENFLITNVKKLSFEEIKEFLEENDGEEND